jgi:hypothetical protein
MNLPFDNVRSSAPLTDADYEAIRANVLARIKRPRVAPIRRFALAASIAALLIVRPTTETPPPPSHPHPRPIPVEEQAPSPIQQRTTIAAHRHHHRHHRKPTPRHPPMRIEIATADPDVRIIWLSGQQETTP